MRSILTIAILISSLSVMAQTKQTQDVPLCRDTKFWSISPCLTPIIGGYNMTYYHFRESVSPAQSFIGFSPLKFKNWVFVTNKGNSWYIENPQDHNGEYIIHINTKKLIILNDSIAIYKP